MTSLKFTVVPHPPYSPDLLETLLINHPSHYSAWIFWRLLKTGSWRIYKI